MEIEIRAKIDKSLLEKLKPDPAYIFSGQETQKDTYFKHSSDAERRLVLRIREEQGGATLTFKAKAVGQDTAWPDVDLPLSKPKDLENILRSSGYVEVVTIQKTRWSFRHSELEVNIDEIKDLGWFVEIEGRGTEQKRQDIEKQIEALLKDLGISEKDVVREGYVPLMLRRQSN